MTCPTQKATLGLNCFVGVVNGGNIEMLGNASHGVNISNGTNDDKVYADGLNPNRIVNSIDWSKSFSGQVFYKDPAYEEMMRRSLAGEPGEYFVTHVFADGTETFEGCCTVSINITATSDSRVDFTAELSGNGEVTRTLVDTP